MDEGFVKLRLHHYMKSTNDSTYVSFLNFFSYFSVTFLIYNVYVFIQLMILLKIGLHLLRTNACYVIRDKLCVSTNFLKIM